MATTVGMHARQHMRAAAVSGRRVAITTTTQVRRHGADVTVGIQNYLADCRVAAENWARDAVDASRQTLAASYRKFRLHDRAVSRILHCSKSGRWYDVLQVRRKATKKELKDRYRRLAKRVHPDKTRDDRAEAAFNALRDAYDLLNDGRKREHYDAKLAREDAVAREKARQRRVAMWRATQRSFVEAVRWSIFAAQVMWKHKRVTAGVLLLLMVRGWAAGGESIPRDSLILNAEAVSGAGAVEPL